jgi:hypothetical protein
MLSAFGYINISFHLSIYRYVHYINFSATLHILFSAGSSGLDVLHLATYFTTTTAATTPTTTMNAHPAVLFFFYFFAFTGIVLVSIG